MLNWLRRHKHDWVVTYCEVRPNTKLHPYYDYGYSSTSFSAYCKGCGKVYSGEFKNMHFNAEQLKECLDARGNKIYG